MLEQTYDVSGYALLSLFGCAIALSILVLWTDYQYRKYKHWTETFHNTLSNVCDGEWELYRDDRNHVKVKAVSKTTMGFHNG